MSETVLWNGVPIDDMPPEILREIIIELVRKADADREAEHQRQVHAFDHLWGEWQLDKGTLPSKPKINQKEE